MSQDSSVTLKNLVEKTIEISDGFPKQMDRRDRMIDLMEEVGELAQAMLIVDKRKTTKDPTKQRTVHDIGDSLSDVLFNMILLARDYDIDLGKEYMEMLDRLRERLDEGEFEIGD